MEQHNSSINEIDDEKTSLLINTKSKKRNNNNNNNNQGISWYFAVFLIVNAALGAGLLNFAKAFNNAGGILAATLIHLVLIIIICIILINYFYLFIYLVISGSDCRCFNYTCLLHRR